MVKKRYYVDIPSIRGVDSDDDAWLNVEVFDTKKEAIEFAQKCWGADKHGNVNVVTEGREE